MFGNQIPFFFFFFFSRVTVVTYCLKELVGVFGKKRIGEKIESAF